MTINGEGLTREQAQDGRFEFWDILLARGILGSMCSVGVTVSRMPDQIDAYRLEVDVATADQIPVVWDNMPPHLHSYVTVEFANWGDAL